MDGWITIGTELSTDKFDRQIANLEQKMKKEENQKIEIEVEINAKNVELENLRKKAEPIKREMDRLNKEITSIEAKPRVSVAEYQKYGTLVDQYNNLNHEMNEMIKKNNTIQTQLQSLTNRHQKINDKITEYKTKVNQVNLTRHQNELKKVKDSLNGANSSIVRAIQNVGKWALAIFSVRSAYMMLRRASSDLASYDPQYAANLEYIRFVLTQAIAPVLKWIVELASTLLGYIYAILNAWFGIGAKLNLGVDAFKKMKANAGGVSKAVKEIKKELLGFDEITRLTDQSSTGTSAGAGGVGIPDFDVTNFGGETPKWLQWIIDHKKEVLTILGAIAATIAGIKIANFLSGLGGVFGVLKNMSGLQIFGLIAGAAIAIKGIIDLIPAIINYIQNPTWDNFVSVLSALQEVLIGVGIAMIALNASNPTGWILLAVAAVIQLVKAFGENEKKILSVKDAQEKLNNAIKEGQKATDDYINAIDNAEEAEKKLKEAEDKHKISGQELYDAVEQGTINYKNMNEAQREVYKAYLDNKRAQGDLIETSKNLTVAKQNQRDAEFENALAVANETGNYEELKNKITEAYDNQEVSVLELRDIIERAMANMDEDTRKTFLEGIPDSIKSGLNPDKYVESWNKLKRWWQQRLDDMKYSSRISLTFGSYGGGFSGGGGYAAGGGGSGRAKGGIFYPSQLPKLALGGIINLPGRGMAYNGAIIGERGAEAVVPLTDNQQMELLGATIGKYITVNANIINTMNGRIISRELKQVRSEEDFAYNT